MEFLSTLSLRRATVLGLPGWLRTLISIHALLAESDGVHYDNYNLHCVISIHALLAESDRRHRGNDRRPVNFYPRSPCGERRIDGLRALRARYFYPRSPCGERLYGTVRHT